MVSLPGFFTPSEAFRALRAGATGLKLFPAEGAAPAVVKAQRAVLPSDLPLLVVGGISPLGGRKRLPALLDAGAAAWETVLVSAGQRGLQVELTPADLLRLTGAASAALTTD